MSRMMRLQASMPASHGACQNMTSASPETQFLTKNIDRAVEGLDVVGHVAVAVAGLEALADGLAEPVRRDHGLLALIAGTGDMK